MDFAPEKSTLKADEIRPSRLGGEGTGEEGAVEEADGEVLLLILAGVEYIIWLLGILHAKLM
jgi:hypothetical protein